MPKFDDALRGYAHPILARDNFVCTYCGLDGKVWPNWVYLSLDHLVPEGDSRRDDHDYIVAACRFCNELHNKTMLEVIGKSPQEIIDQKKPLILKRREDYKDFWKENVKPKSK